MADEENAGGTISYSIKELLDGIKSSVDRLYGKLDTKADRSELLDLTKRVNHESKRVDILETTRNVEARNEENSREWTKWLVPSILTVAMLVVSIVQLTRGGK